MIIFSKYMFGIHKRNLQRMRTKHKCHFRTIIKLGYMDITIPGPTNVYLNGIVSFRKWDAQIEYL